MTSVQLPQDPGRRRISGLAAEARDEGRHALAGELDRLTGVEARSQRQLTIDASDEDTAWLPARLTAAPSPSPSAPASGPAPVPAPSSRTAAVTYSESDFVADVLARVDGRIAAFLAAARRGRNPGLRYFLIRDEESLRIVNVAAGWVIDEQYRTVLLASGHLTTASSRVSDSLPGRPGSGIDYVQLAFRGRAARKLAGDIQCADARGVRRARYLPFPGTYVEPTPERAVRWADRIIAGPAATAQSLGLEPVAEGDGPPPTGPASAHPVLLGRRAHDRTSLIATGAILGLLAVLLGFAWAAIAEEGLAGGESLVLPGLIIAVLMFTRLPWLLRVRYRRHRIRPDTCVHCGTTVTTRVCRRCGRVARPEGAVR